MKTDFSNVLSYYNDRLSNSDCDSEKVGWGSVESQQERYSVLLEIGFTDGDSILDVGCGLGDLYGFLAPKFSTINYKGVDINPNAISIAISKYPQVPFEITNILNKKNDAFSYDYVVSSGALSVPIDNQLEFVFLMLSRMYEFARKGIAVNFLSIYADRIEPGLYYMDPSKLLDMCLRISRKVILRHDYFTHDLTVYIYR